MTPSLTGFALPALNLVAFIVTVVINALSSSPRAGLTAKSNKEVSDSRLTAFTPAGYAFAIWGFIYAAGAAFMLFQLFPSRWEWVHRVVGFRLVWNLVGNCLWLFAFGNGWGDLWVSVVVLFLGILAPLILLHSSMGISYGEQSTATLAETLATYVFVSLYMGWSCVAAIANVAVAATPEGSMAHAGLGAHVWSIIMQVVATALGAWFAVVRRDVVFPLPIVWALFAIGVKQAGETYDGHAAVATSARVLASLLLVCVVASAGVHYGLLRSGKKLEKQPPFVAMEGEL
jgi:hypothetical protein